LEKIKAQRKTLIHIDAHLDFAWMKDSDSLNIGNYLYPAIKEGIIKELYWVVPTPIWKNPAGREYLKEWLYKKILSGNKMEEQNGMLSFLLMNAKVSICDLEALPVFNKNVMLDIDMDFFVTSTMQEADFPHRHERTMWLPIEDFSADIQEKAPFIEYVTISHSVKYGYTPIEFRALGDKLLTKLAETL